MQNPSNLKTFLTIHELFEKQVDQNPEAIAVISETHQYSYYEINQKANQLANYLQAIGIQPGSLVGICLARTPLIIIAILGILKAGSAYVPIDPSYPKDYSELILEDSNISVLLTEHNRHIESPESIKTINLDLDWLRINQEDTVRQQREGATGSSLAYVIYTSGSTGRPKGVMIEHQSLVNFIQSAGKNYNIKPSDRILQFASISFDISVEEIFTALTHGATLVLRSQESLRSISAFVEFCNVWEITVVDLPTAFWHKLCAELPNIDFPKKLRLTIIGGERAVPQWLKLWKQHAPSQARLVNTYGPTEATVVTTWCDLSGPNAIDVQESRIIPIGKPIDNAETYILDEDFHQVSPGEIGQLYIAGSGLARGYINRPKLTAEKYIYRSLNGAESIRLYQTGDRVRQRKDGHLEFLGRVDNQEKIRGFRIELNEIENVIEQHDLVREALVISREDRPGNKQLVAYIVPTASDHTLGSLEISTADIVAKLKAHLQKKLPGYMVPSFFMVLKALPLSPNGKVDRRALPIPIAERPSLDTSYLAPRTPVEDKLSQLWSVVLGIQSIGINDNFFDLGGNSLQTMEIIAEVEKTYQVAIHLLDFFQMPTINDLATLIQKVRIDEAMPNDFMDLSQLEAEVDLASKSLSLPEPRYKISTEPVENILLTGATGFLGSYVLRELIAKTNAKIFCLLNSQDYSQAQSRISETLARISVKSSQDKLRIVPVLGDLTKPRLGLSEAQFSALANSINQIFHSGANVNLFYPYNALKNANVGGTLEILRLASNGNPKALHYVSTLDVFEPSINLGTRRFREEDCITTGRGISGGYAQTKWIAERLVANYAQRGLPAYIYRPGMITGHSQTGDTNIRDSFNRFIKSLLQLKKAPDIDLKLDMTPVDYVSQAIVNIAMNPLSTRRIFHLVNPQSINLKTIIDQMKMSGHTIKKTSISEWFEAIESKPNSFRSLAALVKGKSPQEQYTYLEMMLGGDFHFDQSNTQELIGGTGIVCPTPDQSLFQVYLDQLESSLAKASALSST